MPLSRLRAGPRGRFTLRNTSAGSTQVTRTVGASAPVAPGETYRIRLAGRAGITDASAPGVQVTAVGGSTSGYLTVWSGEGAMPRTTIVSYQRGQVVGGLSTVAVAASGCVAVTDTSRGTVHLVVDLVGHVSRWPSGPARPLDITPSRAAPSDG